MPPPAAGGSSVLSPDNLMGGWNPDSKTNFGTLAEGWFIRSIDGKLSVPVCLIPVNPEDPMGVVRKLYHRENIMASLFAYAGILVHAVVQDQGASNQAHRRCYTVEPLTAAERKSKKTALAAEKKASLPPAQRKSRKAAAKKLPAGTVVAPITVYVYTRPSGDLDGVTLPKAFACNAASPENVEYTSGHTIIDGAEISNVADSSHLLKSERIFVSVPLRVHCSKVQPHNFCVIGYSALLRAGVHSTNSGGACLYCSIVLHCRPPWCRREERLCRKSVPRLQTRRPENGVRSVLR